MIRWSIRALLIAACLFLFPQRAPAPLVYTPGEGWTYEPVGKEGKWRRARAKEQLELAQEAFDRKDYGLALKAARRVVKQWPLSDYAPQAQYLVGRCYEAKGNDERAFREYEKVIRKYPKQENYNEILQRQYAIANRFLAGQWFKLFGYIPFFPSMTKTAGLFQKIVDQGAYSEVAPQAQLKLGAAHEKRSDYAAAVKAYELAIDRYSDRPEIAAEAFYRLGLAYNKQALRAEYDQSASSKALTSFSDFATLYPEDPRVPEVQKIVASLKNEQARGNFEIAKWYEKHKKWNGALIYYGEVVLRAPASQYAEEARQRIFELKKRTQQPATN